MPHTSPIDTFDVAVSISAIHYLCHDLPDRNLSAHSRVTAFFQELTRVMVKPDPSSSSSSSSSSSGGSGGGVGGVGGDSSIGRGGVEGGKQSDGKQAGGDGGASAHASAAVSDESPRVVRFTAQFYPDEAEHASLLRQVAHETGWDATLILDQTHHTDSLRWYLVCELLPVEAPSVEMIADTDTSLNAACAGPSCHMYSVFKGVTVPGVQCALLVDEGLNSRSRSPPSSVSSVESASAVTAETAQEWSEHLDWCTRTHLKYARGLVRKLKRHLQLAASAAAATVLASAAAATSAAAASSVPSETKHGEGDSGPAPQVTSASATLDAKNAAQPLVGRPNKRARRGGGKHPDEGGGGRILSEFEKGLAEALTAEFGSDVSLEDMTARAEVVFAILHASTQEEATVKT